jgi:predicted kinase
VDRCNVSVAARRELLELMGRPLAKHTACVYFNVPREVCEERIRARVDHPTIRSVHRGMKAIASFAKTLEPPEPSEGFGRVYEVQTFSDVDRLLASWGCTASSKL